jgi:hypothetical protein
MDKASDSTLWNKPSSEWTALPRAAVTDAVMKELQSAVQATDDSSRERLERFNIPLSEETLRSRVW